MRILHLTYWYPHEDQPQAGIFIKNHIDSLNPHCENDYFHLQVIETSDLFKKTITQNSIIYKSRFAKYYTIQEKLTLKGLKQVLKSIKKKEYDLINIHIATPIGKHLDFIRTKFNVPIVITEHWTAYYRFFGLPANHPGLQRIKNIFHQDIKLITVSKALGEDIKKFSNNEDLKFDVVPNIISTDIFKFKPKQNKDLTFFMLTNWSPEKNPITLLKALNRLDKTAKIRIGGDGILLEEMKTFVDQNNMNHQVVFLGRIDSASAAEEFQNASAFIHAAHYETFSVVCAEALCCGCPVIASNIPAITEYLSSDAGVLVADFEEKDQLKIENAWFNALNTFVKETYNREKISDSFSDKFGHKNVSQQYFNLLRSYAKK